MATAPQPSEKFTRADDPSPPAAALPPGREWDFFAVVGTSVQGGHTLARLGPSGTALDALRVAVQSVNHTAYSMLEQGVPGDPCAESRLLERLPITEFSVQRCRRGSADPDPTWSLSGGRHQRLRRAA
ncbi:hypothetical protein ACFWPA_18980 [Rhodococcus sp. NPDC058505]|uniref:hypothetical protein n=1 Tax=unclassified Rhodococcus (in: high G+C Gram-positive bacteria) TaxID=192944 RepID=UPI00365A3CBB